MIAPLDPANSPTPWNDDSLARTLRLDLEDEERRALLGSYAISTALGVAFLLLQQFGPRSEQVREVLTERKSIITMQDLTAMIEPTAIRRDPAAVRAGASRTGAQGTSAVRTAGMAGGDGISRAFAAPGGSSGGGLVGDPAGLLRGVAVSGGAGDAGAGSDAKRVLGFGEGGQGSAVPGRSGLGTSGGGSGIGGVGGSGTLGRAQVDVNEPAPIAVAPVTEGSGSGEALGTLVRAREAELRFCYEENLRTNPALAGSVTVAITVASTGSIQDARVIRRTWTGAEAAAAEACMLRTVRTWRLKGSGAGTYSFPFSFTR